MLPAASTGKAIGALCLCHFAQYYSVVSVYSYIGFLAAHNGWAGSVSQAGFVSGFLGGAMPFASDFATAIETGWVDDEGGGAAASAASGFFRSAVQARSCARAAAISFGAAAASSVRLYR